MENKSFFVKGKEYIVEELIGHGKGGYSYRVSDEDGNIYTLKKLHHEPCDYYSFGDKFASEMNDYNLLKDFLLMPKLIETDKEKEIIIKEYIDGDSIDDLIKQNIDISKYLEQIKMIASKCYKRGLNIDYYPTNFIVYNDQLYYVDYECNKYMEEWNFENWGIKYWQQ